MSSKVLIPFNNNPASTSVKNASYTIPAGKYAHIATYIGNLTIDGANVIPLDSISASFSTPGNTLTTRSYDPHFSKGIYITTHTLAASNNTTVSISYGLASNNSLISFSTATRSTTGTTTTTVNDYFHGENWFVSASNQGNLAAGSTLTWVLNFYPFQDFSFWVKSGTVLNGANYLVTEYNQIS